MSGTMTIGRVGRDTSLPLTVPESGRWSGDTLSLSGTIGSELGDQTKGRVLRDQFHGLADRTGRVLPVTFADTPELDGWYRLRRSGISSDGASFATGIFDVSVELERVTRSANVLQEMRMLGAVRTNSHSFTTVARGWYSPGVRASGLWDGLRSIDTLTRQHRTGADGAVLVVVDTAADDSLFDATSQWYVTPADFYAGGCNITRLVSGAYYTVIGEHIPYGYEGAWAIGNTLVSVFGSTTAGTAEFSMLWHDGAAWESFKTFRITADSSYTDFGFGPTVLQVIRNDVDEAAVRLLFGGAVKPINQVWLDIVIRRGARHAEFRWHSSDTSAQWGVRQTSASAGTNHTSGLHATSADSDGNKWILTSALTMTKDTTNGRFYVTSAARDFPFMIGAEMAGAGSGFDDFTSQVYQYFGAVRTNQRTVTG